MKAKAHSKQKLMKKTSALRKQFKATKKPKNIIKKSPNSLQARKTHRAFFEDEQSFKQLFENMSSCVAIYTASANGKDFVFKDFNKSAEKVEQIDRKTIIGKSVLKVFPGVKDLGLFKVFQRVWKTGKPEYHPTAFYKDTRIQGWKENYVYKLPTGEIVAIYDDITERKQAEEMLRESEEKYRTILDNIEEAYYESDLTGNLTFITDSICRISGYSREESIGMNNRQYTTKETAEKMYRVFNEVYRTEKPVKGYDYEIIKKNGAKAYVSASILLLKNSAGRKIGFRGMTRDITARKRAEEELRQSEKKYRLTFASTSDIILTVDSELKISNITPSVEKILGYKPEELINKPFPDLNLMTPESLERAILNVGRVLSGADVPNVVYNFITKEGLTRTGEVTGSPIVQEGKIIGISCVARDITERVRAEEALRESEENFRRSLDDSPLGVCVVTAEGETLYANQAALDMYGYESIEELRKTPLKERYTPESYAEFRIRKKKRERSEFGSPEYDINIVKKNGEIRNVQVFRKEVVWNGAKQFQIIYHDVTDRKKLEDILEKEREELKLIIDSSPIIVFYKDRKGRFIRVNRTFAKVLNIPEENFAGKTVFDFYSKWTAQSMTDDDREVFQSRQPKLNITEQYESASGTRWVHTDKVPILDKDGMPIGLIGFAQDITERKQAESQREAALDDLRKSEEKYRNILGNIEDGYYEVDLNGNFTFFNNSMCRILGYSQEEMMGMNNRQFTDEETAKKLFKTFNEVYRTGEPAKAFDWQIIRKDGAKRYIETSISLRKDSSGKLIGFRGIIRDITERGQAEEALRESENYFKEITENSSDIIVITDKNGDIKYCSRSIERFTGYKPEELIGRNALTLIHPDDKKRAVADFGKAILTTDSAIPNAFLIVHKDGSEHYFEGLGKNLLDNPAVAGFIMNVRDITERKQAEEKMRESEEKYRNILENMQEGYFELDLAGNFTFINDAECRNIGYPREELIGMNNRRYQDETAAQGMYQLFSQVYRTSEPVKALDVEIIKKNGMKGFNEVSVSLIRDAEGKPIGFRGISRDITERKRAEEALSKSEEKYRSLIENAQEGIYQSAVGYLTLNPALARMLGYASPEEVMATITDIAQQIYVHPDDRRKLLELVNEKGSVTDFETEYYKKDGSRIWVSINMRAVRDDQGRLLYYQGINQDITEKKKIEDERRENIERLRKSLGATINAMAVTVETRDPYTAGHQRRVADLARAIATEMNLKSEQIDSVRMASMIHDIGKISIPSEILTKPTQLTTLEFNLIKTHPVSGYNILKDIEFPWPIARIVLEHHERINGSGYPNGLTGEQILLESRILAIADVVEAISSHRPYRAAHGIEVALDEITKNKGILYDPDLVDACMRLFREKNYNLAA